MASSLDISAFFNPIPPVDFFLFHLPKMIWTRLPVTLNPLVIPTFLVHCFPSGLACSISAGTLSSLFPHLPTPAHAERNWLSEPFPLLHSPDCELLFLPVFFAFNTHLLKSILFLGHRLYATSFPSHPHLMQCTPLPCSMKVCTTYTMLIKLFHWKKYLKLFFVYIILWFFKPVKLEKIATFMFKTVCSFWLKKNILA